ncbi:alpha/beta hydrolase [Streptomyces violascens]|uniref:alpha/beta hydrolase n=1 Tax=Streptomyces violascens TaxID=67381 RepID=UPI0019B38890|nr:hypothetical protein [Streptomyces violascens]GGU47616.1 hypothetical protein GCM10010289_80220 [Streptomyces violascens]
MVGVTTHAFNGARPLSGKYPLVVLSAGWSKPRMTLTSLATELVSHGYIVALIGHPYEDSGETLANGQTSSCPFCTAPMPDLDTVTASRALDVSFVLDQLTHGNRAWPLAHLIDKHDIGMAVVDRRRGGRPDDGRRPAHTGRGEPGRHLPPGPGTRAPAVHDARRGLDRVTQRHRHVMGRSLERPRRLQEVADRRRCRHGSFTDLPVLTEQAGFPVPPELSPERGVEITRDYVAAFFDQRLKGVHSTLLDGPSAANPEVHFQS